MALGREKNNNMFKVHYIQANMQSRRHTSCQSLIWGKVLKFKWNSCISAVNTFTSWWLCLCTDIIKLPHYVPVFSAIYFWRMNHINFTVETTSQRYTVWRNVLVLPLLFLLIFHQVFHNLPICFLSYCLCCASASKSTYVWCYLSSDGLIGAYQSGHLLWTVGW